MIEQRPDGTYAPTLFEIENPAPRFDDFSGAVNYVEDRCGVR